MDPTYGIIGCIFPIKKDSKPGIRMLPIKGKNKINRIIGCSNLVPMMQAIYIKLYQSLNLRLYTSECF